MDWLRLRRERINIPIPEKIQPAATDPGRSRDSDAHLQANQCVPYGDV